MPEITISDLTTEHKFTDYHARRGEMRDAIRYGVYPNIKKFLGLYAAFVADYGPDGASHDKQIWDYYQAQLAPVKDSEAQLMAAAAAIVAGLEAIEAAAPGAFAIQVSGE